MQALAEFAARRLLWLVLALAPVALAQEPGPDALVRAVSRDVISAIKDDKDLRDGNQRKLVELVAKMVLPHVDTARMTRLALGANWRQATPTQQQRLRSNLRRCWSTRTPGRWPATAIGL